MRPSVTLIVSVLQFENNGFLVNSTPPTLQYMYTQVRPLGRVLNKISDSQELEVSFRVYKTLRL